MIGEHLATGYHGSIYTLKDDPGTVIKVSENKRQLKDEAKAIKRIQNYVDDKHAVPDIKSEGLIKIE